MENFKLHDRVRVIGKNAKGRIAFIGKTHLAKGVMYGIELDKPKGRCSGLIGGVRYFMCPKDHGVFVRACQLEIDSGNSSYDSEDYSGGVVPRPNYPNYLKYSSKLISKKSSRSKERTFKENYGQKQNVHKKQTSEDNTFLQSTYHKLMNDPQVKVRRMRRLSVKPVENRVSIDEKFRFLAEKINTQSQQLHTIHNLLKKLKTYERWSRGFGTKGNQMKILLDGAIDDVITNMENAIVSSESGDTDAHRKSDAGLEKENALLLRCICDLEKKNETLLDCLTKIRDILQNSWRSRSRNKSKSRKETFETDDPSEIRRNNCSQRSSEYRSAPNLATKSPKNSSSIFRNVFLEKKEFIKRFLESLNYEGKNENQKTIRSSLHSKKENRQNDNMKEDANDLQKVECVKNYLESINFDIKDLNKELNDMQGEKYTVKPEERVGNKNKATVTHANTASPCLKEKKSKPSKKIQRPPRSLKGSIRSNPYPMDKKLKPEKNNFKENVDTTEDAKDPTKELTELISNIMTNINFNELDKITQSDSSRLEERTINPSETYLTTTKYPSIPDSDQREKVSNSSKISKSENNTKQSKSEQSTNMKRKKPPKKRVYSKQALLTLRKQTQHQKSAKKD